MKIAFITNFCPHYRIRTFETLAKYHETDFYFFSAGDEWYWQQSHGKYAGEFNFQYLPGFKILGTRITPIILTKLLNDKYDVIIKCITGRFVLPITYIIARIKHTPFILWTGIWMRLQTPSHRFIFPLTNFIYHHADAIVVYGEHVKQYLLTEGVASNRIFVTTHAVDNYLYNQAVSKADEILVKKKLNITENQKIILFLGRLEVIKGLPYLIQAFALLNRLDTCLVFVGEGLERKNLEMQIDQLGIGNRIRFAGYVSTSETLPYYAVATMLVLPSVTTPQGKETWGVVVNEAFNQGLPVIASDAVGAAAGGLVEDGVNGFIIPERNIQALAVAMQKLLDDPDLRQKMGKMAREKIAHWDNDHMVAGFRNAINYVTQIEK